MATMLTDNLADRLESASGDQVISCMVQFSKETHLLKHLQNYALHFGEVANMTKLHQVSQAVKFSMMMTLVKNSGICTLKNYSHQKTNNYENNSRHLNKKVQIFKIITFYYLNLKF